VRSALELTSRIQEKPKEKTIFTVKLEKFDAAAKAKIIREVKALMPNMNLVEVGLYAGDMRQSATSVRSANKAATPLPQAKKFVESCPQTLKENLPKDEAEKLKKTLEGLGATVSLE
jgi:large subunit ribosomal protein L7/L12